MLYSGSLRGLKKASHWVSPIGTPLWVSGNFHTMKQFPLLLMYINSIILFSKSFPKNGKFYQFQYWDVKNSNPEVSILTFFDQLGKMLFVWSNFRVNFEEFMNSLSFRANFSSKPLSPFLCRRIWKKVWSRQKVSW